MPSPKNTKTTAGPKTQAAKEQKTETKSRAEVVEEILRQVEEKLAENVAKATLGDYMKLLQLSKEMTDAPKTEIKVKWIEEPPKTPTDQ